MVPFIFLSILLLCNALPTEVLENEARSLFQDVIKSIKIRSQLSDVLETGDENTVSQQYEEYMEDRGTNHLLVPTDIEYVPRINDRIELPLLMRRKPKQVNKAATTDYLNHGLKEKPLEFIVLIDTHKISDSKSSTTKPKKILVPKQPRPNPTENKSKISNKYNQIKDGNDTIVNESENPEISTEVEPPIALRPQNNNMHGQSQIGNRESQMVIKPTVIVNFRGTITNRDSDIKLEGRNNEENSSYISTPPQNIFNINQDVHIEKTYAIFGENRESPCKRPQNVNKDFKLADNVFKIKNNEDQANYNELSSVRSKIENILEGVSASESKISADTPNSTTKLDHMEKRKR